MLFYSRTIAVLHFILTVLSLLQPSSAHTNSTANSTTNDPCIDNDFLRLNASDSATIPAPRFAGQDASATWTVSTGVTEIRDYASNTSWVKQDWWLKTNPVIRTSPENLPFEGCIFMYRQGYDSEFRIKAGMRYSTDDTNCSSVLPAGCADAIKRQLAFSAGDRALRYNASLDSSFCSKLQWNYPDECGSVFSSGFQFLNGPFGLINYTAPSTSFNDSRSGPVCNRTSSSVFDGSATKNWFYDEDSFQYNSANILPSPIPIGNEKFYDYFVRRTVAVMMVTWSRDPQIGIKPEVSSVCLTPQSHVEAASRNPSANAAMRISLGLGQVSLMLAIGLAKWFYHC